MGLRAPGIPSSAVGRLRGVGKSRANGWEGEEKSLRVAPSPSRLPQGDLDPLPSVPGPKVSAGPRSTSWEVSPRFPTSWGTPGLEGPNTPPALQTRGGHGAPGPVWGRRGPETKLKADPRPQANWHFRPHLSCMGGGLFLEGRGLEKPYSSWRLEGGLPPGPTACVRLGVCGADIHARCPPGPEAPLASWPGLLRARSWQEGGTPGEWPGSDRPLPPLLVQWARAKRQWHQDPHLPGGLCPAGGFPASGTPLQPWAPPSHLRDLYCELGLVGFHGIQYHSCLGERGESRVLPAGSLGAAGPQEGWRGVQELLLPGHGAPSRNPAGRPAAEPNCPRPLQSPPRSPLLDMPLFLLQTTEHGGVVPPRPG